MSDDSPFAELRARLKSIAKDPAIARDMRDGKGKTARTLRECELLADEIIGKGSSVGVREVPKAGTVFHGVGKHRCFVAEAFDKKGQALFSSGPQVTHDGLMYHAKQIDALYVLRSLLRCAKNKP